MVIATGMLHIHSDTLTCLGDANTKNIVTVASSLVPDVSPDVLLKLETKDSLRLTYYRCLSKLLSVFAVTPIDTWNCT